MSNLSSSSDLAYIAWIAKLNNDYLYYSTITIIPFAFFFNTLTILVFLTKKFRETTYALQNILLNLITNILLVFSFLIYFSKTTGKDITFGLNSYCAFFSFMSRFLAQYVSWIYVTLVLETLLSVTHPIKYKNAKHKKTLVGCFLFGIMVILGVLNTPNLMLKYSGFDNTKYNFGFNTDIVCTGDTLLIRMRDLVIIMFRMVLPFILSLVFNILLIRKLIKFKKQFVKTKNSTIKKEYKFAITTIILNFLFIATLFPTLVALVYLNINQYEQIGQTKSLANAYFIFFISQSLACYNYSANFFINMITNQTFRLEFLKSIQLVFTNVK